MFLEHVNLTVSDLDRSVAFYSQLLGFHTRWQGKAVSGGGFVRAAHIGTDDCYLALFEARQPGRPLLDYGVPGLNHFGFVVDDLDAAAERLAAVGGQKHMEYDYAPGRRFYCFDPDGIELELVETPASVLTAWRRTMAACRPG